MKFTDLQLIEPLLKAITKERYVEATPIQEKAIPHLLADKDLIGIAQTGTGKTAAFVLPLLQKLSLQKSSPIRNRPKALILAPTRELAAQISNSCATYGRFTNIKHTVIYGGVNQGPQVNAISRGVDILIATPGRLLDLIEQRHIKLDDVQTFILDEADRMLDMGFVPDIKRVFSLIKKCQTIMFSATMSSEVSGLANHFLKKPIVINVVPEGFTTIDRIKQELFFVDKNKKIDLLLHLMEQDFNHVLIFTRTKAAADKVSKILLKNKIKADAIHGDKSQAQRTRVLKNFQAGKIVLVATDVAARGIDVDGISHVINFDLPNEPDNYIHRIGRTARAGANGIAFSFCDETEKEYLKAIEKVIKQKLKFVDHPFHSEIARNSTQKPPRRGANRNLGIRGRKSRDHSGRNSGKKREDSRYSKDRARTPRGKFDRKKSNNKSGDRRSSDRDFKRSGDKSRFSRSDDKSASRSRGDRSSSPRSGVRTDRSRNRDSAPRRPSSNRRSDSRSDAPRSFSRPRSDRRSDRVPRRSDAKSFSRARSKGRASSRPGSFDKPRFSKDKPRFGRDNKPRNASKTSGRDKKPNPRGSKERSDGSRISGRRVVARRKH